MRVMFASGRFIMHWALPGMSGLDICRAVRSKPASHYTYLIVITAREGEEGIAEAMAAVPEDGAKETVQQ